jgi:DNA-binding GntR family transcriptional regulator
MQTSEISTEAEFKSGLLEKKIKEILFFRQPTEQKPITEEELVKTLGKSRVSVREELKALEREGLIVKKQKKGLYLRKFSIKEIEQIFDVRLAVEGFAARLAINNTEARDLAELKEMARKHIKELKRRNTKEADSLDVAFHRKIVKLSGNKFLLKIMDNFHIMTKFFKIINAVHASSIELNLYSHEEIVRYLKEGDPNKVEVAMRNHIQWAKKWLIEQTLGIRPDHFDFKF